METALNSWKEKQIVTVMTTLEESTPCPTQLRKQTYCTVYLGLICPDTVLYPVQPKQIRSDWENSVRASVYSSFRIFHSNSVSLSSSLHLSFLFPELSLFFLPLFLLLAGAATGAWRNVTLRGSWLYHWMIDGGLMKQSLEKAERDVPSTCGSNTLACILGKGQSIELRYLGDKTLRGNWLLKSFEK